MIPLKIPRWYSSGWFSGQNSKVITKDLLDKCVGEYLLKNLLEINHDKFLEELCKSLQGKIAYDIFGGIPGEILREISEGTCVDKCVNNPGISWN